MLKRINQKKNKMLRNFERTKKKSVSIEKMTSIAAGPPWPLQEVPFPLHIIFYSVWTPFAGSHLTPLSESNSGREEAERLPTCTTEMWVCCVCPLLRNLVTFQLHNHHDFFSWHARPSFNSRFLSLFCSRIVRLLFSFFLLHWNKNAFGPTAQPSL